MDNLKVLPPPKASDTFGNTAKRKKTVSTGHARRPIKGLTQFNVKIRARARERFEEIFEDLAAKSSMTKGELLEAMIDAWARGGKAQKIPASAPEPVAPAVEDAREDRTVALPIFVTKDLAESLQKRAKRHGWTLSATFENACAVAQKAEADEIA